MVDINQLLQKVAQARQGGVPQGDISRVLRNNAMKTRDAGVRGALLSAGSEAANIAQTNQAGLTTQAGLNNQTFTPQAGAGAALGRGAQGAAQAEQGYQQELSGIARDEQAREQALADRAHSEGRQDAQRAESREWALEDDERNEAQAIAAEGRAVTIKINAENRAEKTRIAQELRSRATALETRLLAKADTIAAEGRAEDRREEKELRDLATKVATEKRTLDNKIKFLGAQTTAAVDKAKATEGSAELGTGFRGSDDKIYFKRGSGFVDSNGAAKPVDVSLSNKVGTEDEGDLPPRLLSQANDLDKDVRSSYKTTAEIAEVISSIPEDGFFSGYAGKGSEWLKKATGSQDEITTFRDKVRSLINNEALDSLPPGTASDADIALVKEGVVDGFANEEALRRWSASIERLSNYSRRYAEAKRNYIYEHRGTKDFKGPSYDPSGSDAASVNTTGEITTQGNGVIDLDLSNL